MSACPYRSRHNNDDLCPQCDAEEFSRAALIEQAVRNVSSGIDLSWLLDTPTDLQMGKIVSAGRYIFSDMVRAEFRRLEAENVGVPLKLYDGTQLTTEHISSSTIDIDGSAKREGQDGII